MKPESLTQQFMTKFANRISKPAELNAFLKNLSNREMKLILKELLKDPNILPESKRDGIIWLTASLVLRRREPKQKKSFLKRLKSIFKR